jgi:hypothetical protein
MRHGILSHGDGIAMSITISDKHTVEQPNYWKYVYILEHLNTVTEQFGPVSLDSGQMQIPDGAKGIPRIVYQALTEAEQAICDAATD